MSPALLQSEIIRGLLARGQVSETVSLKTTAKGETVVEVVAVVQGAESLRDAADRASGVYEQLRRTFAAEGLTEAPAGINGAEEAIPFV